MIVFSSSEAGTITYENIDSSYNKVVGGINTIFLSTTTDGTYNNGNY